MTDRGDVHGRFAEPRDYDPNPSINPNPSPNYSANAYHGQAAPTQHMPTAPLAETDEPVAVATPQKKRPSAIREILETLLLAVVIFFLVRAVVLNFRVEGLSMTPNLSDGEMLLVNRNAYAHFDLYALVDWLPEVAHAAERTVYPFDPPERGDIVVFDPPTPSSKPYIKRVIGLPGERVTIRDGSVFIDGQQLNETYLRGEETDCPGRDECEEVVVPEGHVFVLGDNRDNSQDSRGFGPVPVENIIGKAWVTYWPSDDIGIVPHYDYPEIAED
jgi:signal peptidase I